MTRRDRGAGREGGATPALHVLRAAGIEVVRHDFDHDRDVTAFGQEAVEALGVDASRVAKTLLVHGGTQPCVALVPVPRQLDLKAAATALGLKRTELLAPAQAQRTTGYPVGAISPLGQRTRLRTVVDVSLTQHASILVSGGRRGLEIELAPGDLIAMTDAVTAPIAR